MGAVRQLVDELRRRGVTVNEWPGWDGRGNADGGVGARITQISPVGAVIHHTGSQYGSAYGDLASSSRPDLFGGCLCNFAGNEDGSLTVIASGLAWHAGAGVGPNLGPVLGAIPNIRNRMNPLTVGLEIVYPGDQPMRPAQYQAAVAFARTVADLFGGGNVECIRGHFETNGNAPGGSGKWDPGYAAGRSIDMAAFRQAAANFNGLELDVNLSDPISFKRPDTGAVVTYTVAECLAWTNWYAGQEAAAAAENAKIIAALKATVDGLVKALGSGGSPAAGSKLPTEFDVPGFATLVASQVVDIQNKQARDGDPATGPVS